MTPTPATSSGRELVRQLAKAAAVLDTIDGIDRRWLPYSERQARQQRQERIARRELVSLRDRLNGMAL